MFSTCSESSFIFSAPCNQRFVRFTYRLNLLRYRSTPLPLFLTRHLLLHVSLHRFLTFSHFPPPQTPVSSFAPFTPSLHTSSEVCLFFCEFVLQVTEVIMANRLCGNHSFLPPPPSLSFSLSLYPCSMQQVFFTFMGNRCIPLPSFSGVG